MRPAVFRRVAFIIGVGAILGVAIVGTILQRRSMADYSSARSSVRATLHADEALLRRGETRASALAALRAAGADVRAAANGSNDLIVTVLRELSASARCRSLVGQLHVSVDRTQRIASWETPPLDAECN